MAIIEEIKEKLDLHPKTQKQLKNIYEKYMFFIGIAGQLLFYFQAYKIFSTKSACSVSLQGFAISLVSLISWLIYGVMIKNKVLIFSNLVAVLGCSLVLTGIVMYR